MSKATAFESWLKQSGFTVNQAAALLYSYAAQGDSGNLVWDYLKRVGDKEYTQDTFVKAAKLALRVEEHKK